MKQVMTWLSRVECGKKHTKCSQQKMSEDFRRIFSMPSDALQYPFNLCKVPRTKFSKAAFEFNVGGGLFHRHLNGTFYQNCLQWGRSNLVDPAEWPKIRLINRAFGKILSNFPRKNSKTESSLTFLQSGPPENLLNLIFSGTLRGGGGETERGEGIPHPQ